MNEDTLARVRTVMAVWWQSQSHYDPACALWEKAHAQSTAAWLREVRA